MVRNYKKKRIGVNEEAMLLAMSDILEHKLSFRKTADKYGVNVQTLKSRIIRLQKSGHEFGRDGRIIYSKSAPCKVFTAEEEGLLNKYILDRSKTQTGLTPTQVRSLAYEFANDNNIKHPLSWTKNKMAGVDWLASFRKRNSLLNLRKSRILNTPKALADKSQKQRSEIQLIKWDKLKVLCKTELCQAKRERVRSGSGSDNFDQPSPSSQDLEDPLEFEGLFDSKELQDTPQVPFAASKDKSQSLKESTIETEYNIIPNSPRLSEFDLTDYDETQSQGSRNIQIEVKEELPIDRRYDRFKKRQEELHILKIAEKEWIVKTAEENYFKVKAERQAAEELLRCNRAKREEAELRLATFKKESHKDN